MTDRDRDTFAELTRKRGALDRDVANIIGLAGVIEERLHAADATVATPSGRDRRSRGSKGPSDPTGGALVGTEGYATRMRSRWHQTILGHRPTSTEDERHGCPDLEDHVDDLDPESLAGMAARVGVPLDELVRHCRHHDTAVATTATHCPDCRRPLPLDELETTIDLANRLQDSWYLLFDSRQPDTLQLSTITRDLGHVRRRLAAIADDLRLWSDQVHPAAANRCPCRGDGCNHTTRCARQTDGVRTHCGACRSAQSYLRQRASA